MKFNFNFLPPFPEKFHEQKVHCLLFYSFSRLTIWAKFVAFRFNMNFADQDYITLSLTIIAQDCKTHLDKSEEPEWRNSYHAWTPFWLSSEKMFSPFLYTTLRIKINILKLQTCLTECYSYQNHPWNMRRRYTTNNLETISLSDPFTSCLRDGQAFEGVVVVPSLGCYLRVHHIKSREGEP